uniref:Uncharacterized protein n=1 Tax=Anopheles quadriannulatus TaxID=34691 RepID=A0A182XSW2_ANOQN
MEGSSGSKIRPLEQFDIDARLMSIKRICTELAASERWCEDKLCNISRLHRTMLEMMKDDDACIPPGMMVDHPDGESDAVAVMRLLQLLLEQKRSLEEKTQRLEEAIRAFKEQFEKLF